MEMGKCVLEYLFLETRMIHGQLVDQATASLRYRALKENLSLNKIHY